MTTIDPDGNSPLTHDTVRSKRRSSKKRRHRTILIRVGTIFLGTTVLVGVATGILIHQAKDVEGQFEQAMNLAPQLRSQLGEGNYEKAQETFENMSVQIAGARSTASGPLWKAATILPFVGPNFSAVTEIAVSADDIAERAAAPLLRQYGSLDWKALSPVEGKIDVTQLEAAAPTISAAANTLRLSYERVNAIDHAKLLPQIAAPVRSATDQLEGISEALDSASAAGRLLPSMLGGDKPRQYLILIQNNAEVRATGGISGALAGLTADSGMITLSSQDSASSLGAFNPPLEVDPQQESLFTSRIGAQMQNVNLTPDFPTAGRTAARMWEERHTDETIDGVLAIDPVVLGYLLEATGPVTFTSNEVLELIDDTSLPRSLSHENVVSTLLSDVYREIDNPSAQDKYFAAVAEQVFAALLDGHGDNTQLMKALSKGVQENRLHLWSSHADEQQIVATTPLSGSVVGAGSGGATFGVYFNDGTGAKMDYYVNRTVQIIQACSKDEYGQFTVRVTATNNAPADAATSLPAYVTGGGVFGVEPGRIRTNYVVYGPSQAFVETATVDGQPVPVSSGKHGLRPVGTVSLELGPGETSTIEMIFSGVVQDSEPQLRVTPTIQSLEDVVKPLGRVTCG